MPTYVTLIHYTEQGVNAFKDLPQRLDDTRKAGEALGAKPVAFYLTMGQYDAVVISDAPTTRPWPGLRLQPQVGATFAPKPCAPSPKTRPRASRPGCKSESGRPGSSGLPPSFLPTRSVAGGLCHGDNDRGRERPSPGARPVTVTVTPRRTG